MLAQLSAIKGARVLVVGDVMVDHYISGRVRRVSPEAPVPVLNPDSEWTVPGGAANVVLNLKEIGAKVGLVCALGTDNEAGFIRKTMIESGVVLAPIPVDSPTPKKTRVRTELQHIVRIDQESTDPLQVDHEVLEAIQELVNREQFNVILMSDYSKGLLSEELISSIIELGNRENVIVLTDPKKTTPLIYRDLFLLKPNVEEARALTGWHHEVRTVEDLQSLAEQVRETTRAHNVVVTGGPLGAVLVSDNGRIQISEATAALNVVDVSGAGDTFISYLAAGLSVGVPLADTSRLATLAATISCTKVGTSAVRPTDIVAKMTTSPTESSKKIIQAENLALVVDLLPRPIVFTNGCFDVLHPGHVSSLEFARQHGETLIVGVNSDASVRRLKGESRPLQTIETRLRVLSSLAATSIVCSFDEDTPLSLIEKIRPDFLVKGNDYADKEVVGAELIQSYGGKILYSPLQDGYSTTQFAESITDKRQIAD